MGDVSIDDLESSAANAAKVVVNGIYDNAIASILCSSGSMLGW